MHRINLVWLVLLLSACVMVQDGPTQNEKASKINVQLGIGYYQQGNLEQANEKLLKALAQDPTSSQAHYAFAVLQNRFLNAEKTEYHFKKAIELNPNNSEALTNYGAYLCNKGQVEEAESLFLRAVENPLYKSPELAYTNAAVCLLKADSKQTEKAKAYLMKALAARSNYTPALINMAEITFDEHNYELSQLYVDRFHLFGPPTSRSLWLNIQNEMNLNNQSKAFELAEQLKNQFPESKEYQSWIELNQ